MHWLFFLILTTAICAFVRFHIYQFLRRQQRFANYYAQQSRPIIRKAQGNSTIDISGEVEFETERAYRFYDGSIRVWLPKSQCEWDAHEHTMTMEEWLAKEKGLI